MNFAKKIIRRAFIYFAFYRRQKIVIASTGRSGSTMLFDAIADGLIAERFRVERDGLAAKLIKRLCTGYLDRISTLPSAPCFVCKTHDTYDPPQKGNHKYVFVYGDPLDSAMSVEQMVKKNGLDWFALHQYHLKANGAYSDLYEEDVLNYHGQIESWLRQANNENVFCVDYEDLWSARARLSGFLGFNVELPARRPRLDKPEREINKDLFDKLRGFKEKMKQEYESLIERDHRL